MCQVLQVGYIRLLFGTYRLVLELGGLVLGKEESAEGHTAHPGGLKMTRFATQVRNGYG